MTYIVDSQTSWSFYKMDDRIKEESLKKMKLLNAHFYGSFTFTKIRKKKDFYGKKVSYKCMLLLLHVAHPCSFTTIR